jgi:hypothetical protein
MQDCQDHRREGVMRLSLLILAGLIAGCSAEKPAYVYPAAARVDFAKACPTGVPECDCTWDKITRAMPVDEYEAAMATYLREGVMDRRLTMAKAHCAA